MNNTSTVESKTEAIWRIKLFL